MAESVEFALVLVPVLVLVMALLMWISGVLADSAP
jgi:ABC-type uncharacterized transport system permease subunit